MEHRQRKQQEKKANQLAGFKERCHTMSSPIEKFRDIATLAVEQMYMVRGIEMTAVQGRRRRKVCNTTNVDNVIFRSAGYSVRLLCRRITNQHICLVTNVTSYSCLVTNVTDCRYFDIQFGWCSMHWLLIEGTRWKFLKSLQQVLCIYMNVNARVNAHIYACENFKLPVCVFSLYVSPVSFICYVIFSQCLHNLFCHSKKYTTQNIINMWRYFSCAVILISCDLTPCFFLC